jgi:hypothetical protein
MDGRNGIREVGTWVERWGFPVLVGIAILAGLALAATVAVPPDVPTIAMRAVPVYRLEVGGALFAGLYAVTLAFVLALRNRGFTEIATSGVRAHDLARVPEAVAADRRTLDELAAAMSELRKGADDGKG